MRLGEITPLPRLAGAQAAMPLIAGGIIVLILVHGVGGIIVGCAMVAFGVCKLMGHTPHDAPGPVSAPSGPPPVHHTIGTGGRVERITRERRTERITRERHWPVAG